MPALIFATALAASGVAQAAEPEAVATAPATAGGAPPSGKASDVAEQIDTYLKTSPAVAAPNGAAAGVAGAEEPRKVHGVVDVAVGSGGYRSAFVQGDIPVGKTGTVSIAVGETRFDGRLRRGRSEAQGLRCRQAEEPGSDLDRQPRFDGGRPRPCPAAEAPRAPR